VLFCMPVLTMQKHMLCKSRPNAECHVFGRAIASKWYHIFDESSDACEICKQIIIKENLCNPNVEIHMYVRGKSTWDVFDKSSPHLVGRHFIPYHIRIKGGY